MKSSKPRKKIVYSTVFATITMATILSAAVEAVVGYVAVYFFAPFWGYLMQKRKGEDSDIDKH